MKKQTLENILWWTMWVVGVACGTEIVLWLVYLNLPLVATIYGALAAAFLHEAAYKKQRGLL